MQLIFRPALACLVALSGCVLTGLTCQLYLSAYSTSGSEHVQSAKWVEMRTAFISWQITQQIELGRMLPLRQPAADQHRQDSFPLISGDTYRSACHWIYDETRQLDWLPAHVEPGHMVFVKTDMLDTFFTSVHPQIVGPYILITSNSDHPSPGPHLSRLNDPNLHAWFGQNADGVHDKFRPLPIGFPNREWKHGDLDVLLKTATSLVSASTREHMLYVNMGTGSNPDRQGIIDAVKSWDSNEKVFFDVRGTHEQYLQHMSKSYFVLSPAGNGIDCHRNWEAILMGSIPVVQANPAFGELSVSSPVLVIEDFSELTPAMLYNYQHQHHKLSGVFANYWFSEFDTASRQASKAYVQ